MALFKKRPSSDGPDPAIAAFWDWWATEGRALAEASISGTEPEAFGVAMTEHVRELGDLAWELSPGETTEHVLVISPGGDPEARATARRVVLAAPDADATWSYIDSRPPVADPEAVSLSASGADDIDLARVRVSARMNAGRFDVQVHHPAFADLSEDGRLQVTFLALDKTLGELDTELWLGEVVPVEFPPLDGFGLTALRAVVQDLKRQRLDPDGRPGWAMLRGETARGPLVAMVRSPLHPLTAPHLDTYVGVALPYTDRSDGGLPGPDSLDALRWFEERLEKELGAGGQLVAHLSSDGTRTLHLYVDSTAGLVPAIRAAAKSWDQGRASVHEMHDPAWQAVSHLSG